MKINNIKLIIFDWDGTLVDSIGWIVQCMQQAAVSCGIAVPDEAAVRNVIGLSIERALETLFVGMEEQQREHFIKAYSQCFFSKAVSREDVFEGVPEMLTQLKAQGFLLAVATGKRSTGLGRAMQGTGLGDFFDVTCGVDQAASKPDPLMINQIVAQLDVEKSQTVMVGDSIHDLQMANNAAVDAVAVCCGAHDETVFKQYQPLACLQNTRDLVDLIS